MNPHLRSSRDDGGFGLIELIVAIVITGVLITAIASIFINSWRAQEDVTSVNRATNTGQLIGSMIERAVRNAEDVDPDSGPTDTLIVRTCLGSATTDPLDDGLKWQGFAVTEDTDTGQEHAGRDVLRITASSENPGTASESWPVWQPHLHVEEWDITVSETGEVSYQFEIETDSSPVRIAGSASPRSVLIENEDEGCWS